MNDKYIQQPTVNMVLQKTVESYGGSDKLASISDQVWKGTISLHILPPEVPQEVAEKLVGQLMPMIVTYKRPNKLRYDVTTPDGQVFYSKINNGSEGWMTQMGMKMKMTEQQFAENDDMIAFWVDRIEGYKARGYEVKLLPDEMIDNNEFYVLQTFGKVGNPQKFYINKKTNLIERQVGQMLNMQGEWENMYIIFEGCEKADGIIFEKSVTTFKENGEIMWVTNLMEVQNNIGVEDDLFE